MSTQQPKALRLADELEIKAKALGFSLSPHASELRRLHKVNEEMLEALKYARGQLESYEFDLNGDSYNDLKINAAIAKATGNQK